MNRSSHLQFGISFSMVAMIMLMAVAFSGCAVKQPGNRTFNFGPDGTTITSETVETSSSDQVELAKEQTRQVCYKQNNTKRTRLEQLAESQPLVYALIAQTETINNAVSLAITKRPYDPCPSSTNSSDVEIADSAMYTSIYKEAFSFAKFLGGSWLAKEAVDGIVGAIAKAGTAQYINQGDGDFNIIDSFKTISVGPGGTTGNILLDPSTVENILPDEPLAGETLLTLPAIP